MNRKSSSALSSFVALTALLLASAPANASTHTAAWSGFYAGVNAGYSWGSLETDTTLGGAWSTESQALRNAFTSGSDQAVTANSLIGGVQAGYNMQMDNNIVLGVELDVSKLNLSETGTSTSSNSGVTYNFTQKVDTDWLVTLRPRAGYAFNNCMVFVTGGLAFANSEGEWTVTSSGNYRKEASDRKRFGYTLGGGMEHNFGSDWGIKVEYLYTRLGNMSDNSSYRAGSAFTAPDYRESIEQDLAFSTLRVGLNFNF